MSGPDFRLDILATEPQFLDHLAPVWCALPPDRRGAFVAPRLVGRAARWGIVAVEELPPGAHVLVASYGDLKRVRKAGRRSIANLEHGAGQSYAGSTERSADEKAAVNGSYPGGEDHADVALFLTPNEHSANRWRRAYPLAQVAVVGSPRLDHLPARRVGPGPTVALSFHWDCKIIPETRSALWEFRDILRPLAKRHRLIGHGHPRLFMDATSNIAAIYGAHRIEVVRGFGEVCERADVLVCDNSSALFEFASTGRPVVVLNSRHYRRRVEHGLRFWEAADVGVNVNRPEHLHAAIERALEDPPEARAARERALALVYAYRSGAAERAANAVLAWASGIVIDGGP